MSDPRLHIDFETRAVIDLKRQGLYRYAEDKHTDILCASFKLDGTADVGRWVPGQDVPPIVDRHIRAGHRVVAHNAAFERAMFRYIMSLRYGWPMPEIGQWDCTMARGALLALPLDLGSLAWVLGIKEQKDDDGRKLMLKMCKPVRIYRKTDRDRTRYQYALEYANSPDPVIRKQFVLLDDDEVAMFAWSVKAQNRLNEYCDQDVRTEEGADHRLPPMTEFERRCWILDQEINDRGIRVDLPLIEKAQVIVEHVKADLTEQMFLKTGGYCTPTETQALLEWLVVENGLEDVEAVDKAAIKALIEDDTVPLKVKEVLKIRQIAAKSSVSKLGAMKRYASLDGRMRGSFQFSAAHTKRWGGRNAQPQNLMRPTGEVDIPRAIRAIDEQWEPKRIDYVLGPAKGGGPLQVVAECMRGMIIASPGNHLVTGDFSNIEGVVNAWIAGEKWKLQAFLDAQQGKGVGLYEKAAAGIYHVDPSSITKEDPRRQIGKVAELSMGYQGGINAFTKMAKTYGVIVDKKEANKIKTGWRALHPAICDSWAEYEMQASQAVRNPGVVFPAVNGRVKFLVKDNFLWLCLPNGGVLAYCRPHITVHRFEADVYDKELDQVVKKVIETDAVHFWGRDSATKKWKRHAAYGGFWCENIVQATSREILVEAAFRVADAGYPIVMHAHDELVAEVPITFGDCTKDKKGVLHDYVFERLMAQKPTWALDCPIAVEGWRGERYRK